ncbi:MAG: CBS domain-containing protein [Deltaproteobacteria bacterium]|nr:CBS domain-containing protein [Deltaproteobacteria bacterium]
MQVITTHINADFDGLAAMIAAQKIYPDAIMVFSGSQEKNLRDFINETLPNRYDFAKLKHIDLKAITRLIVVDTRNAKRIGAFAACLDNPGLSIHLFDHHPDNPEDMKGDLELVKDVGSTTTLFTQIFQERQIPISALEATIFGLGIYEDTGSLTHLTTRPADLQAAAWLLEQGAQLETISQFITYDLTARQVELLHDLMETASSYTIQGIEVVVVTLTLPEYVDDFALIVRRFMIMENLDTLFALVSMAGRIYLIGRSRIPEVNTGTVARDFGGGGHANAASATIHDMTLIEAQDKLIRILHRHIRPQAIAQEMLSQPVISVPAEASINQAHYLLTRYNITTLPVVATDHTQPHKPATEVVGIITRRVIEKAIHHALGHLPVSEYMTGDIASLPLSATLSDIEELIIEHRQRLIPIVHNHQLAGVITQTDLLNMLVNDPAHLPKNLLHETEQQSQERTRNLNQLIAEFLDKELVTLLQTIGEVADSLGFKAFAVGGFVRDLLLQNKNLDLDIVVEGDGIIFARELAQRLNGQVKVHERFITAMIRLPDWSLNGLRIDVATARLEYYDYPAALPTIELSSIKLDLYRRDFTINAMAIQLNPARFGTLIDFFNCQGDLKEKTIKVLHNLSFVEDPTRIFRAIRFEKRMDFRIDTHTSRLIQSAVKMNLFGKAHDPRFFTELKLIFSEENPLPAINRLAEFKLFQFLWPDLKPHLKIDRRFNHILTQAEQALSWFHLLYLDTPCPAWQVYLLAIMGRSKTAEVSAFCQRFGLPPKMSDFLIQQKLNADKIAHILYRRSSLRRSELYWLLKELANIGLLYLMAIARKNEIKQGVSLYVTDLRKIKTQITGADLKAMGYPSGPQFKAILNELLTARLDGVVQTKQEEEAFIQHHFPQQETPAAS